MDADYEILGWPPDGPQLRLDHERFAYAGKFVMTNTGKAVARGPDDEDPIAAVSFNADRTDASTCWIRYVTVRADRRGEGFGPRLVAFVRDSALEREYETARIAVNNPFAYQALHRAGFGFTGETTGIAELVLEFPPPARGDGSVDDSTTDAAGDPSDGSTASGSKSAGPERYRAGLEAFRERDLSDDERSFVEERLERGPPEPIDSPEG